MPLAAFHPAVAQWFERTFSHPTPAQAAAWPAIAQGRHTLVAAPTGSGKTLTAFLAALDALVRQGIAEGGLRDEVAVVYVSPLKALSNDIRLNLDAPLAGIRAALKRLDLPDLEIRTAVRTGDTPARERQQGLKRPPHVLVTTPESLYVLLGSLSGRRMLSTTRTLIVDEIHALAGNKRGSHLALSMERLQALCTRPPVRIGLSATQKPLDEVARFLVGAANVAEPEAGPARGSLLGGSRASVAAGPPGTDREAGAADAAVLPGVPDCAIVDIGYAKQRDLALELPPTPLGPVMSTDQWAQVHARLVELIAQHRTTLVFVNTRRMAERTARHLGELLGKDAVAAHHGSLSKELRLRAEQRLKRGDLKVLVATASLELGLDIGEVDLVCQLASTRSIAAFLQRAGRSGHAVGGVPKARLFPSSRDELVECAALLDAINRGELDALRVPPAPLDVLAQQIVAETACQAWDETALFDLMRRAWPYRDLPRERYDAVLAMLADGFTTRQGQRGAYVHHDRVHHELRERRGARMTALTSGGTIPETGDYAVVLEPQAERIGSVNEDFAVESIAGDIFQLGNTSYRILRVEPGRVRVEDAHGVPPNIPFWLGEAPGRSDELSFAVARLREDVAARLADGGEPAAVGALSERLSGQREAAQQIVQYLARGQQALGAMPTQRCIVIERFFDASGGMQLVIHSPLGSRVNKAWGLALRKRFCRQFNFELQAAATEDAIVLSLSESHSFPLDEVPRYLRPATALDVLVQALLDAPLFAVRWRWNATTALALPRYVGGRKVAPQLQRMKSEDLLAAVFPDQVACAENLSGPRDVPDHPLVSQTLHDCLHEAMDAERWLALLRDIESGAVQVITRDLSAPSPLAAEALNARPYAFLDDAPLEERRTQAVMARRYGDAGHVDALGRLDADAIAAVREEAWPTPRSADEMHEALGMLAIVPDDEAQRHEGWSAWLQALADDGRVSRLSGMHAGQPFSLWVTAERLGRLAPLYPDAVRDPAHAAAGLGCASAPPSAVASASASASDADADDEALRELLRARLSAMGPVRADSLAALLRLPLPRIEQGLLGLQREGSAMLGHYSPDATAAHRYSPDAALAGAHDPPGARGPGAALPGAHGQGAALPGAPGANAVLPVVGAPDAAASEWCERHLLARIHRYTLGRLRREIEPVEPRDFARFLFDWQRVADGARTSGPAALAEVLAQLEGYEAPAALWESDILAARVDDYAPHWLDSLTSAGRSVWARLRAPTGEGTGNGASLRAAPIVLLPRREATLWSALVSATRDDTALAWRAARVAAFLSARGASFFDEIEQGCRLLRAEVEEALAELVVHGRVTCDSFAGLRALLVPASKRGAPATRGRRTPLFGMADAGRWALIGPTPPIPPAHTLVPQPEAATTATATRARTSTSGGARSSTGTGTGTSTGSSISISTGTSARTTTSTTATAPEGGPPEDAAAAAEHVARVLLRRYGVVCWRLTEREAPWLPPWRELVRIFQRLEARGEVRGGRFIAGLTGEQFALPEAIAGLRQVRRRAPDGECISLAAADPANLLGTLLPGPKPPRVAGARVAFRDGLPLATSIAGQIEFLHDDMDPAQRQAVARALTLAPALRLRDAGHRRDASAA
jgi:ATP-dependent Lhr-like helicase